MPSTPIYGLPAPDLPDIAHGPDQILALGEAIEGVLTVGTLKMTGGAIEISEPTSATNPVTKGYFEAHLVIGPAATPPAAGALPSGSIYFGV